MHTDTEGTKMKPFTYFIGWSKLNTFYYGRRTANGCDPDELWKTYFTSSKYVKKFRKEYGEPDIIQIRKVFDSVEKCIEWECKVLLKIDAQNDPRFLNKRNGDNKWDTTGMVNVRFNDGTRGMISITDPRYLNGETIPLIKGKKHASKNKNTVTVKDKNGEFSRVSKDDPRYVSGELVGVNLGLIPVRDKDGNGFLVEKDDPRFLSGEVVHVSKGVSNVKCKGMVTVRGSDGKCFNIPKDDPRYLSGELVAATKGMSKKVTIIRGKDFVVTCPHCGTTGGRSIMKRWHFDNCKHHLV